MGSARMGLGTSLRLKVEVVPNGYAWLSRIPAAGRAASLPPEAEPRVDDLVTEDDSPVDNLYSEKQQRLLTEPLYASWSGGGRPFLAAANVGVFYAVRQPPIVPDAFLSLDVQVPDDLWLKSHRSYFFWEYGEAPEAVFEIVLNREGDELGAKMEKYAQLRILYYVVWDPAQHIAPERLRLFVLREPAYTPVAEPWLPAVGLGLRIWHGPFEGVTADWLRWCDADGGSPLSTGTERADRLAAQLRALGAEPEAGG